jgi:hypothetical protein
MGRTLHVTCRPAFAAANIFSLSAFKSKKKSADPVWRENEVNTFLNEMACISFTFTFLVCERLFINSVLLSFPYLNIPPPLFSAPPFPLPAKSRTNINSSLLQKAFVTKVLT